MYALILAGGDGTRLWPLSRKSLPKQFLALIGGRSMIQETVFRMADLVSIEKIRIVTGLEYAEKIVEHLPELNGSQVITEPYLVGTNLAIGLGLIHIAREDPRATVLVGWSDAHISQPRNFVTAVKKADARLDDFDGIIVGSRPTYPATCYGYIEVKNPGEVSLINSFTEKPGAHKAEEFLVSGKHLWNTGISLWRVDRLLKLFQKHTPEHFAALMEVQHSIGTSQEAETTAKCFSELSRISIDKGIFEKAESLGTIPVDMGWSDIGSWSALYDAKLASNENVLSGNVVEVETKNCLISSTHKMIAAFGVEDLVVVETDDVILIARKSMADDLKMIHHEVLKQKGDEFE